MDENERRRIEELIQKEYVRLKTDDEYRMSVQLTVEVSRQSLHDAIRDRLAMSQFHLMDYALMKKAIETYWKGTYDIVYTIHSEDVVFALMDEPPEWKVGQRVRFLNDICDDACGDHPLIVWAERGDTGYVESACPDGHSFDLRVLLDRQYPSPVVVGVKSHEVMKI